jgi:hypothetical protein
VIEDAATRARWIATTKAHEQVVEAFRALLAAKTVAEEHKAKRGLLGSLIAMGFVIKTTSIDLIDVDLSYGNDALPVEWHLPDIIDIESE